MDNLYAALTTKIIEKKSANPGELDIVRQEIKFIAEQLKQEQDLQSQIDAAFCYYIAGYYVQALYIAEGINLKKINLIQGWLLLFLSKHFGMLEESVNEIISDINHSDQYIKEQIDNSGLSDIEAVNMIVEAKIAEVISGIIAFIQTGDESKATAFLNMMRICQTLFSKSGQWINWWRVECLKLVISEFIENSLWSHLKNFSASPYDTKIVEQFILAAYNKNKMVELWRTQVESLPRINDPNRCSFCVSVPTSGGKTTVAELAILRFLLDYQNQPETKCVYIAPFKKLALEVESGLSKAFSLVDTDLASTFYGGREIDVFENRVVERSRILIVTPEKLDSMLRQYPNLLSQIKLVVADEGHMIGDHDLRGYRYRLLLERLIYRLRIRKTSSSEKLRIILISGVLPNVNDFAELISGDRKNIVKVDWRPLNKPTIGSWDWTGKNLHTSDPNLVEPIPFYTKCQSPDGFEDIVAKVALSYAHLQPTMVFSASKKAIVSPSLLNLLECVVNHHKIFKFQPLPTNLSRATNFRQYYTLLERGIAIHHGSLPRDLRKEMEKRIDNQQVRLLFASPTLANGVNIPFHNILVYRLQHYYGAPIPHATFWNVVGRVGRPIKNKTWSNLDPPIVLFFLNKSPKSNDEDQKDSRLSIELMDKRAQYQVVSPFLKFLAEIRDSWNEISHRSIADLFNNLAEKERLSEALGDAVYSTLKPINKTSVDDFLQLLDEHICALLTENEVDKNNSSEWLQQSASDLVNLFVKAVEIDSQYLDDVKSAVLARLRFNIQHLSSAKRYQSYLLGLPAKDCEEVKRNEDLLLKWYRASSGMFSQDFDHGLENFMEILRFISTLSICAKWKIKNRTKSTSQLSFDFNIPDQKTVAQNNLFRGWINGEDLNSLEGLMGRFLPKADLDDYREGMFEHNLPWGVSAICRYLNSIAEQKSIPLTKDLDYLSAFVKYGVNSKIACQLVRYGIPRFDAVRIGTIYRKKLQTLEFTDDEIPSPESDLSETLIALSVITEKELKSLRISKKVMVRIIELRKKYSRGNINAEPEIPPYEFNPIDDSYLSFLAEQGT